MHQLPEQSPEEHLNPWAWSDYNNNIKLIIRKELFYRRRRRDRRGSQKNKPILYLQTLYKCA
jgi:hypothetical protein